MAVDEFLEKLQEDQRRMRQYLRAHGDRFKQMGRILAASRLAGGRVFVLGEPPLDSMATLLAEEYLTQLPVLPIDLLRPAPPSVDSDEGDPVTGRMAAARQAGRHLHKGDVLVAFMHGGDDRETRAVLEAARAKRLPILVVGGLDSKQAVRRVAKVRLTLPTRGIKTVCESVFVCARIMARVARAALVDAGEQGEGRLVQLLCDTCNERVFVEEELRGRQATCPLCQATLSVPRDSTRRAAVPSSRIGASLPGKRERSGRHARPEPSEDDEEVSDELEVDEDEPAEAPSSREAPEPEWGGAARAPGRTRSGEGKTRTKSGEGRRRSGEGRVRQPGERERERERPTEPVAREAELDPPADATPAARRRRLKPSVMEFKAPAVDDEELGSAPTSPSPAELTPDPVGLVSHEVDHARGAEPTFGSGITVGSDLVPVPGPLPPPPPPPPPPPGGRGAATTQSADPYALEDAFLQDLELPADRAAAPGSGSASDPSLDGEGGSRRLSSRYTIGDCRLRWGRGGYPDETSPQHQLVVLSSARLSFFLDPDDEAGSTLQKGDELWLRVDVPAFIEPILVRGVLKDISGTSGGGRGARATLEFTELDPAQRRKLARAAENIFGAPA